MYTTDSSTRCLSFPVPAAGLLARLDCVLLRTATIVLLLCCVTTAQAQFGPSTEKPPSGFKKFTSSVSSGFKKTFSKKEKKEKTPADEHDPLALANKPKHIDADFYVSLARLQEQAGAYDAAEDQYQNALKEDKKHLPAMMGLAHIYERKRDLPKAIAMYERAAKSHPQDAGLQNDLGLCYRQAGKLDEAIAAQHRAVELQPGRKLYRNNLATSLVRAGRAPEALTQLLTVHKPATAHYNIGYLLTEVGDQRGALYHFQKALEFDPSFAPARQWLATLTPTVPQPTVPQPGISQPAPPPQMAAAPAPAQQVEMAPAPAPPPPAAPPVARVATRPAPPSVPNLPAAPPAERQPVHATPRMAPPEMSNTRAALDATQSHQVPLDTHAMPAVAAAPPTATASANGVLPRIVEAGPVAAPQRAAAVATAPASLPQWTQTPHGFVQRPESGAPGAASPAGHRPPAIDPRGAEQVASRAQPAGRIQNPAAQDDLIAPLDETAEPVDAPLPIETARRPAEYRAPSRY
jgi:tetratricopeptide (TPR) repeat protein